MISVIIPTNRVGGLDILFDGLEKQTFKDFEVVLVDSIHKYRKSIVAEHIKKYSFECQHVEPANSRFPVVNYQQSMNTGLSVARGSIAYFTCDYSLLPPENLKIHADFHAAHPNTALIGPFTQIEMGKTRFPKRYGVEFLPTDVQFNEWADQYVVDLEAGLLDDFMWKMFDEVDLSRVRHVEPKATQPEGPIHRAYCHLKQDSFPIDALRAIGGFDERYDGSHGWQDSEVTERLYKAGLQFHLQTRSHVYLIDVHQLMTIRKMERASGSNEQIYLSLLPR